MMPVAWILVLLGAGCGLDRPDETGPIPPDCAALPAQHRDWCTLAVVGRQVLAAHDLTGPEVLRFCQAMSQQDAVDQCLELAVRSSPPAPARTCQSIQTARLHDSCYLSVADSVRRARSTLAEMLDDCAPTGAMREFCVSHVVEERTNLWQQRDLGDLQTDLIAIVERFPDVGRSPTLAVSVHLALTRPGMQAADLAQGCALLPAENQESCLAPAGLVGPCPAAAAGLRLPRRCAGQGGQGVDLDVAPG